MVLARFLPRDEQFFDHFNESAANALETAKLLTEIIEFGPDTERKVRRLRDLEHTGDDITHRIYQALNSTFVTPLDRDDIRDLAAMLDDFVDGLEEAGKRIWLYQMGVPTEPARLLCQHPARAGRNARQGHSRSGTGRQERPARSSAAPSSSTGSKTRPTMPSTRPWPRSTTA